jgi:hypothetical protein
MLWESDRLIKCDSEKRMIDEQLRAVVAPVADALALSSSPFRRSVEAGQTEVHEFLIPGLLPAGLQQRRRMPHVWNDLYHVIVRLILLTETLGAKMGEVIRFIPKSERDRTRLIREARAIYDSIFPATDPVSAQHERVQASHAIGGANAHPNGGRLLS